MKEKEQDWKEKKKKKKGQMEEVEKVLELIGKFKVFIYICRKGILEII